MLWAASYKCDFHDYYLLFMKIQPKVLLSMLNSQLRHQVQILKNHKIRIVLFITFCYMCHLLWPIILTPTNSKSSIEKMLRTSNTIVWSQNFSLIATNCKEYIRKSRYYIKKVKCLRELRQNSSSYSLQATAPWCECFLWLFCACRGGLWRNISKVRIEY